VTTHSDSVRFSRALRSAILWPVCVIFFFAFLMLLMIFMLMKVVKFSEHSYSIIAQTHACEELVVDTQDGVRGDLLAPSPGFPATLAHQRAEVDDAFDELGRLVRNDPDQTVRMEGLIQTKNLWFDRIKASTDQRSRGNGNAADLMKVGDGLMENLRAGLQTFTKVQENLHDQRIATVQTTKAALGFAGGALVLILACTVGLLVRRQFIGLAVDYRSALGTIEQRHAALVRSEAELEEQKEWFRVTLSSIGDGVIVTNQEGRIVFLNHEAERMTGWTSVEALLKPLATVFRLVDEHTRARVEDPVERIFREKRATSSPGEAVLISRTGDEFPVENSMAPIKDSTEKVLGVVVTFHNATDTRLAQNALKIHSGELEKRVAERTAALQQTVSELESFSYTVSHDLRSPLRAMQGFSQAVLEDYGDKLDDQARNYLGRIKNASERLDRLIQDLLSYTRIARMDAPLVPLDMDKIARDIIEIYPNLHSPEAQVRIEGTLPRVLGQEASLTQVISNLLGNAVKFVRSGATPEVRIWSEDLGPQVRLWIEDNGIGISPENFDRIFSMFIQVDESHLYGGTGVGLAIVKKAVESMQGRVGVESSGKGGASFWVELNKAS
jgi:PAS domain S-box-containing protein